MKLTITTTSSLLTASGDSTAHIDADVKYCRFGFPYIAGKTFKGLLRESAIEVCEILGYEGATIEATIGKLFGLAGLHEGGVLKFDNLRVKDYEKLVEELQKEEKLSAQFIQSYFTTIRKQTSIQDGVAKNKSLRVYRLVKKGQVFETHLEGITQLDKSEQSILEKALAHLRFIGTRRNRGFGNITIQYEYKNNACDSIIQEVTVNEAKNEKEEMLLTFAIKALSPLLFSKPIGDQNTVGTEDYVPAQKIRGLLAELIIKDKALGGNAHADTTFQSLILNGDLQFHHAVKAKLTPLAIGIKKTEPADNRNTYNAFFDEGYNIKPIKGWYKANEGKFEKIEVRQTATFHSSRPNRQAGRSTTEAGAIFYYESIEEGQVFYSTIKGSKANLAYVKSLFTSHNGVHRMGRSKTAQYASVQLSDFEFKEIKILEQKIPSSLYLYFKSAVILYNEFGVACPTRTLLQKVLGKHIEIEKIISANNLEENFIGVWQCKSNRENAFAMGTTLQVKVTDSKSLQNVLSNGIGERKAEGYGNIELVEIDKEYNYPIIAKRESASGNASTENVLDSLLKAFDKQEYTNKLKSAAIDNSQKFKLSNSLIYRLREQLRACRDHTEWKKFLDSIGKKKAGIELHKVHLWDELYSLKGATKFDEQKIYWETFFNSLRIKERKNEVRSKA